MIALRSSQTNELVFKHRFRRPAGRDEGKPEVLFLEYSGSTGLGSKPTWQSWLTPSVLEGRRVDVPETRKDRRAA